MRAFVCMISAFQNSRAAVAYYVISIKALLPKTTTTTNRHQPNFTTNQNAPKTVQRQLREYVRISNS